MDSTGGSNIRNGAKSKNELPTVASNMSRFAILMTIMMAAVIVVFETEGRSRIPVPLDCPANQTWSLCGLSCEPSCQKPMKGEMCVGCVRDDSVCRCAENYVRDPRSGGCIKLEDC